MPFSSGPNTVSDSSVVFNYDASDINSYRGQPGTNITTGNNLRWTGDNTGIYSNGKLFKTFGFTELADIPTLGRNISVNSMIIYNVYSGYGTDGNYNCCPSLFGYGDGRTVSPNTVYSYQIIYRCDSGYTHPNYMYHYEYTSGGTYLTEYGVHDTSLRTYLGNGWWHAWNTFTTNASAGYINTGLWYYQYNTTDKVSVAAISIAQGSTIRPPSQLISSGTTRSNTQGLLDVSGRGNSISLSNVSFDSNGQITFDGTDDYINVGSSSNFALGTGNFTIEVMIYPQSFSNYIHMVALPLQSTFALKAEVNTGNIYYYDPSFSTYGSTSGWTLTLNQWNHVVLVRSGNVAYAYLNGVSKGSKPGFNTNMGTQEMNIGWGWGGEFTAKKINTVKMYNRALSSEEISNNYNQYKKRFNLS